MKIKVKQIISVMLAVIMLACSFSIASSAAVSLFCPVGSIGMGTSNGYSSGHQGIDLAQGKGGSPVYAAIGGTVVNIYKCTSTHQSLGDCDGFGTGLIIQGTDGMYYQYAHMQANSIPSSVYVGASVSMGQQIGNVGMTGWATGYHLHFQIGSSRWSGAVNPLTYGSYSTSGGTKTLTVYFNANGGSVEGPSDFYLYNNIIYKLSDLSPRTQIWTYNEPKSSTGLVNASSFTLYRTGYKFSGWGTSSSGGKVFDEDDTSLRPSDICPSVANGSTSITLYAQWTPNKLTVNYYSNYADKSFSGALNTVSSSKNVLVRTATYKYNEAFGGGLHDYSNSGDSTYLGKDGYKGTGYWNTKSDGTGIRVNQSTLFANGQALAKALGKDITNSNATVSLYPEWTPNKLTVNYYSNYADKSFSGALNTVSSSKNVLVRTAYYDYGTYYEYGLHDYNYSSSSNYLGRDGYSPAKCYNTKPDGSGYSISQDPGYTAQEIAKILGLDLSKKDVSVNLYPEWTPNKLTVNYYSNYATKSFSNPTNAVSGSKNVLVYTQVFSYNKEYKDGLRDYSYASASNYLAREGYSVTTNWNTKTDGTGYSVYEKKSFSSGQELAKALGKDISKSNVTISVYPEWKHSAHNYESKITKASTCTQTGIKTYTCKTCGDSYTETIPLKDHTDSNGDGKCDDCNNKISSTTNSTCTCKCHSKGFTLFIWKIGNFFHRIFGMSKYKTCACGKSHW